MSRNMKFQYWGAGHGYWKQLGLLQLMYANPTVLHPNFKCVHWLSPMWFCLLVCHGKIINVTKKLA
jgi:hypothetical protein